MQTNGGMSKWDKLQMYSGWGFAAIIIFCLFGWGPLFGSSLFTVPWTIVMVLSCIGYVITTSVFDYQERKRINQEMSGFYVSTVIKSVVIAVAVAFMIMVCAQSYRAIAASGNASGSASGNVSASDII